MSNGSSDPGKSKPPTSVGRLGGLFRVLRKAILLQESFVSYKRYRWFWINLGVTLALTLVYLLDDPIKGRNGGSTFGYSIGGLSALAIIYLMLFGVRKRAYHSSSSTLHGWLAAHIWLGVALSLWVPLHSAFQFGLNLHSLAYYLMMATILSGIWGAINYRIVPLETKSNRGSLSLKALLKQYDQVGDEIEKIKSEYSLGDSRNNPAQGGELHKSLKGIVELDNHQIPSPWRAVFVAGKIEKRINKEIAAHLLGKVENEHKSNANKLISLVDQRCDLINMMTEEIRVSTLLKVWLYLHVPLACACLVAVIAHILIVLI